jgi:ornithine lipid ester-linked acyl 2-hydroxylase
MLLLGALLVLVMVVWLALKNEGSVINQYLARACRHEPYVFDPTILPWTARFRQEYQRIRLEYVQYVQGHQAADHRDLDQNLAANTVGWKTVYLKVFGNITSISKHFPWTMQALSQVPCTTAYFSILEPGTRIPLHRGLYKGVLKYHLGLIVPDETQDVYIVVHGTRLHWREGQDLLFDDTAEHYVVNQSAQPRVILLLDVKRPFQNVLVNSLNSLAIMFLSRHARVQKILKRIND